MSKTGEVGHFTLECNRHELSGILLQNKMAGHVEELCTTCVKQDVLKHPCACVCLHTADQALIKQLELIRLLNPTTQEPGQ